MVGIEKHCTTEVMDAEDNEAVHSGFTPWVVPERQQVLLKWTRKLA